MMKKLICIVLLGLLMIGTIGCRERHQHPYKNMDVQVEFVTSMEEDQPHTMVNLIIHAEHKMTLRVGEYATTFQEDGSGKETVPELEAALCSYLGEEKGETIRLFLVKEATHLSVLEKRMKKDGVDDGTLSEVTSVIMDQFVNVVVKEPIYKEEKITKTPLIAIEPPIVSYEQDVEEMDEWMESGDVREGTAIDLLEESTEGGRLIPYYEGDTLKCFQVEHYGEMGRWASTYYVLPQDIVFVESTQWAYKSPLDTKFATRLERLYIIKDYRVYCTDRRITALDESDHIEVMHDYLRYKDMITKQGLKTNP